MLHHARARDFTRHRAWAFRLFVLIIASWLYRLEYGESRVLGIGGRTSSFTGWFDQVMAFAFHLPNLVVAETYLRALCSDSSSAMRKTSLITLYVSAALVSVGVYSQW